MNATQAKKLLLPIPKEDFIVGQFTDGESKCCAIGHLQRLTSKDPSNYSYNNTSDMALGPIRQLSFIFIYHKYHLSSDISSINNYNNINGYNEDNPKDRVIHLLDDMIAEGL